MKPLRLGSAISAVALAGILAGCAAPMSRSGSAAKGNNANLALALKAQIALGAGDLALAADLAERAVENKPRDAAVRALLGNVYFASGRFASAEAAYRDSLSLAAAQPQVVLKLALMQIAQGKNAEAIALLGSASGLIDPADHGLALALAGQPYEAIQLLEPAARARGADSRVRQNLALAHALAGDWAAARTIASQDLPADLVDSRIQQWMALAKPARPSDQVASLVGVTPAASDPGQPVRLALNPGSTRVAQAPAVPQPEAAVDEPQPQVEVASAFVAAPEPAPQPVVAEQPAPAPVPQAPAFAAFAPAEALDVPPPAPAKPSASRSKARKAAVERPAGKSSAVVQLGAYKSPERVMAAWAQLVRRYPALRNYTPQRARFDGPGGTVWRLSIRGFDSQKEALARCGQLRGRGGSCFVRSAAGDAPVQLASR